MLSAIGLASLEELADAAVPANIRYDGLLELPLPLSESEALSRLKGHLSLNRVTRTFIGMGYAPAILPPVIQRNVLENPGWYTQYTPYQAEIAQGRLEALLNFQTMVTSLTALPLTNASLLDEATAAAEAMAMCRVATKSQSNRFLVATDCHPQTLAVVRTRAIAAGIEVVVADPFTYDFDQHRPFAMLAQYPSSDGQILDPRPYILRAKAANTAVILATCPLSLSLLIPPGELGADIAIGTTQRLGLPLGFGGPHAAFLSAQGEFKRHITGRIVGISVDSAGKRAYRLALQTREQHIRRERATSNICTSQVLPAVVASFYAVYHGAEGLTRIASHIADLTGRLHATLTEMGFMFAGTSAFDTLCVQVDSDTRRRILNAAEQAGLELGETRADALTVTLGEPHDDSDLALLVAVFAAGLPSLSEPPRLPASAPSLIPESLRRTTAFLQEEVFRRYRTEHELLRYMKRLESRDLSLTTSMIPLGSCTMKLNGTAEMLPLTWTESTAVHPFTAERNVRGTLAVVRELEHWLMAITGMDAVSLQPNSGAQGEFAGLLSIRRYYESVGATERRVCLIPLSAHGTNPASAALAGLSVVTVNCDSSGNVDIDDLRAKAGQHRAQLAAIMLTYPSTHGVFEAKVRDICDIVHEAGGQVYLDGANMNAQVGLCRPGDYGADVCHINLHKTFCIPHGGGGPGMGPIAVRAHLKPHLPGNPLGLCDGAVSAAPFGSGSVLVISWMYIAMMGARGLRKATELALLNANYMAYRLAEAYPILFRGQGGYSAHEFILDVRSLKKSAGVEVDDIAKRLMDYGFHAPTMSFPVPGTLMIEPTESESRAELDHFCDALLQIREEIRDVEQGRASRSDNPLKFAPHTAVAVTMNEWPHAYSREQAAFPDHHTKQHKFWPYVGRIDNAAGDRNLICTCSAGFEEGGAAP